VTTRSRRAAVSGSENGSYRLGSSNVTYLTANFDHEKTSRLLREEGFSRPTGTECSAPCSQQPFSAPWPEAGESNRPWHTIFI